MQHFRGMHEKLARAKENIFNLHSEIERFFREGDYPAIADDDYDALLKAIKYHQSRFVPERFGVLAGEIIHHLRSSFDHIVWHFSTGPTLKKTPVDFPVLKEKPIKPEALNRFEGKIHRIENAEAVALIKGLQPYNAANPGDDPLFTIHNLDIIDKHNEPLLCFSAGSRVFPIAMQPILESYQRAHPEFDAAEVATHFKDYGTLQPEIVFRNFREGKIEPVTQGLTNLYNFTVRTVQRFAEL